MVKAALSIATACAAAVAWADDIAGVTRVAVVTGETVERR